MPLEPRFVEGVRKLTRQYGVVMILDEVITGFRWSPGGLQQKLDIFEEALTLIRSAYSLQPLASLVERSDQQAHPA